MKLRYYMTIRLGLIIPTLLIILSAVFVLMHVLPGDPVRMMYGDKVPEEFIIMVRHKWGLDRPIYIQYIDYLKKLLNGNLGVSIIYKIRVLDKIKQVYPTTIELAFGGIFFSLFIGIPLGILSALKRGGTIDNIIRVMTLYIYSNPSFWLALLFQLFFGVLLGVFPISGRSPSYSNLYKITGLVILDCLLSLDFRAAAINLRYMILPWITVGIGMIPRLTRISRAAMLNVLGEDYITTARAKGIKEYNVVFRHALRNAILPIITIVGGSFAWLMGGTVITESIFSLPGMGRLLYDGLLGRDFELIQGIVVVYAIVVIIVNTFVDVIYAVADPRVEY